MKIGKDRIVKIQIGYLEMKSDRTRKKKCDQIKYAISVNSNNKKKKRSDQYML